MLYPIILVHGIVLKDINFFKAFGRIEKKLKAEGYRVVTARTDGFGTIENNAEQLKKHILEILSEEGVDKVNLIAHSKGGLDAKYMIENLDMREHIASLTTLCTPHKGSPIASFLLRLPKWLTKFMAFWINLTYRILGDKHPDSLAVCRQLQLQENELPIPDGVYCQSYSASIERSRDDFIMGIPLAFSHHLENKPSDGLVSVDSAQFGTYNGNVNLSHSEIVDFMVKKKKRERIYAFYTQICEDLSQRGF